MYTLTSASVLALDLARHPSGAAVADVVDTALALEHVLSVSGPVVVDLDRAAARARLLAAADRAPRLAQELRSVTASLGSAAADGPAVDGPAAAAPAAHAVDLAALQAALVGRLPDLVALVQAELGEVRGLPQPVVDVVVDRAVAAWAGSAPGAVAADVATLSAPWPALVGELPPLPPRSGDVTGLLELLEAVVRSDDASWTALELASGDLLTGLRWSELMHTASRAAVAGDSTVDVARWQLSAARALTSAGRDRSTSTRGAAMSVVGAVQALSVVDLLPASVAQALTGPCRAAGLLPA